MGAKEKVPSSEFGFAGHRESPHATGAPIHVGKAVLGNLQQVLARLVSNRFRRVLLEY